MENMGLKGWWWKISGVVIFLYVIIGGMIIPTRAGVTKSEPGSARSGDSVTMVIKAYNTHFLSAGQNRAWLKLDSLHAVKAHLLNAKTENDIQISFNIPEQFPASEKVQPLTLIIDNEIDGAFVQPNALFVTLSDSAIVDKSLWVNAGMNAFNKAR